MHAKSQWPLAHTAVALAGGEHATPHPPQFAMCRCGHSSNKPFCDGTHLTIDFDGTLAN